MTKDQLSAIRARLDAALTYEPSAWNEEEGAYVSPSEKADDNSDCPLCDGQGFVWSQRYDAKETIAATVVAYGIGEGLARAEEWVEQAPADLRALLDEVERLTHNIVQIERHAAIVDTTVKTLSSKFNTVCDIISKNGCDCVCDCDCEGHVSEDCEPCLACRVSTTLWPNGSADE